MKSTTERPRGRREMRKKVLTWVRPWTSSGQESTRGRGQRVRKAQVKAQVICATPAKATVSDLLEDQRGRGGGSGRKLFKRKNA